MSESCCGQLDWTGEDMSAEHHSACPQANRAALAEPVSTAEPELVLYHGCGASRFATRMVLGRDFELDLSPIHKWLTEGGGIKRITTNGPGRESCCIERMDGLMVIYSKPGNVFGVPRPRERADGHREQVEDGIDKAIRLHGHKMPPPNEYELQHAREVLMRALGDKSPASLYMEFHQRVFMELYSDQSANTYALAHKIIKILFLV